MWALSLNNHIFVAISMILYFSKKKNLKKNLGNTFVKFLQNIFPLKRHGEPMGDNYPTVIMYYIHNIEK
jgi:hypothetical protein